MTSDKIKALKAVLSLAQASRVSRNRGFIRLVQRQLSDIHEQVLALEAAQLPAARRLTADDITGGNVVPLIIERPMT
jgi:hypothetical protein